MPSLAEEPHRQALAHVARILRGVPQDERLETEKRLPVGVAVHVDAQTELVRPPAALAARADADVAHHLVVPAEIRRIVGLLQPVVLQYLQVPGIDLQPDLVEHAVVEERVRGSGACASDGNDSHDTRPTTATMREIDRIRFIRKSFCLGTRAGTQSYNGLSSATIAARRLHDASVLQWTSPSCASLRRPDRGAGSAAGGGVRTGWRVRLHRPHPRPHARRLTRQRSRQRRRHRPGNRATG